MRGNKMWVVAIVLAAVFAAIYGDALGHGFVKDDFRWIAAAVACFDIGAVRALRLKQRTIALVLALPFIVLAAMVARAVLRPYAG